MILTRTTVVAMMLLLSAGCNTEQEDETLQESKAATEEILVAVADDGPPPPASAKPEVKVEKPKKRVTLYIPPQDDDSAITSPETNAGEASDGADENMVSEVGMSPRDRVAAVPKGKLKNPYTDNEEMITAGKSLYFGMSCNGCHGGTGGGGMCPPLSNEVFVYGSDDDTVFRLITLGTDDLAKMGYFRTGMEGVVGPMPPFGDLIKKDEDVWKIIAWMRTIFNGDPKRRNW